MEALPLDDEPHGARRPLRRVRDPPRQQEQLTLPDHDVPVGRSVTNNRLIGLFFQDFYIVAVQRVQLPELASLEDLEAHVSLPHVEELLALLQVVVLPLVGLPPSHVEHLQAWEYSCTIGTWIHATLSQP